jgi:nitrite reductase/ring-hydroxylating ferredoxin subunit
MLGAAVMSGSGFLGGHLSFRLGVGVDTTVFDTAPKAWTAVLDEAELRERVARKVTVGRTDVLLYREGDRVLALGNRCSHRGGPLHKGRIQDGEVRCPWHLSTFRLDDGSIIQGPATAPQPRFDARVSNGKVEVRPAT